MAENTDLLFLNEVYNGVALSIIRHELLSSYWDDRNLDNKSLDKGDRKMRALLLDCKYKITKLQHLFYWM